jgi:hypothetical protein
MVNVRTHTRPQVVNKTNRYQRTTPMDESTNRTNKVLHTDYGSYDAPGLILNNSPSNQTNGTSNHQSIATRSKRSSQDCVFATAITLIRQPTDNFVIGLSVPFNIDSLCLASTFGISRGFLNPEDMVIQSDHPSKACHSLFIISWHGRLIEYILEPMPGT